MLLSRRARQSSDHRRCCFRRRRYGTVSITSRRRRRRRAVVVSATIRFFFRGISNCVVVRRHRYALFSPLSFSKKGVVVSQKKGDDDQSRSSITRRRFRDGRRGFRRRFITSFTSRTRRRKHHFHARSRSRKEGRRGESDRFSPIERRREHFDDDASVVIQQKSGLPSRNALRSKQHLF